MVRLGALFKQVALASGADALVLHGALVDPSVLASALLDPGGAARYEATLLEALDGPAGLTALAARCAAMSTGLRFAAARYRDADQLDRSLSPLLRGITSLPKVLAIGSVDLARGRAQAAGEAVVTGDPDLIDLVNSVTGLEPDALKLRHLYPDGHPQVDALSVTPTPQPRNLSDVVGSLAELNDTAPDGAVDVRILTGVDAAGASYRKVIVNIPGMRDWKLRPGPDPDVTNIGTTLRALAGQPSTYEQGVLLAMRAAGVRPSDDVLLVGHSLGGLIATNIAHDTAATGEFHVSHIITAGSPIGQLASVVPADVQVLAVENKGDIVPHLDGAANPDRPNVTTVTIHHDSGDIEANHDLDQSYLPGARDIDASADPGVRTYLAGLDDFLNADSVQTNRYLITRAQ